MLLTISKSEFMKISNRKLIIMIDFFFFFFFFFFVFYIEPWMKDAIVHECTMHIKHYILSFFHLWLDETEKKKINS